MTRERAQSSPGSPPGPRARPSCERRSASPSPIDPTPADAISNARSTPSADSISAWIARAPIRSARASTSSADWTFGTRTPTSAGSAATASRSASCQAVPRALTRTWSAASETGRSAASAARASSLRLGATASSRSMITTSAPAAIAFSQRSRRSPGTYRAVSGTFMRSTPPRAGHRSHPVCTRVRRERRRCRPRAPDR